MGIHGLAEKEWLDTVSNIDTFAKYLGMILPPLLSPVSPFFLRPHPLFTSFSQLIIFHRFCNNRK